MDKYLGLKVKLSSYICLDLKYEALVSTVGFPDHYRALHPSRHYFHCSKIMSQLDKGVSFM